MRPTITRIDVAIFTSAGIAIASLTIVTVDEEQGEPKVRGEHYEGQDITRSRKQNKD